MRGQLGPLQGNGDVHVSHGVPVLVHQRYHFFQQELTVHALPLIGRVRKKMADVSQGQAAQQGVTQRVNGNIAIRMGDKARF